jgi:hypothetical protein
MLKNVKNYAQNDAQNDDQKRCQKVTLKIDENWRYNLTKIDAKMIIYDVAMGGSKNDKNRPFSIPGPRTPHFINFLKYFTFLQKLPEIRPP